MTTAQPVLCVPVQQTLSVMCSRRVQYTDEVQGSDHIWQLSMPRYGVTVHQSLSVMRVMRVQYIAGMKARGGIMCELPTPTQV